MGSCGVVSRRRAALVSRRLPRQSHPRGAQPVRDNGRRRPDKCLASHGVGDLRCVASNGVGDLRSGLFVHPRREDCRLS
ncbi:unnamed protein product [Urochloa humidicola]